MEQETMDKLYEDFNIEIKPGKGAFKYVRTRHILDRLNKAFNGNWGTHIVSHSIIEDEVLVLASVYIYGDNGQVIAQQQGFGSAKKFPGVELGNVYKSATSKAIKSAVRNWGVALFLEEGDAGSETTNQYQSGKSTVAMPSTSPSTSAMPSMPSATPTSKPSVPSTMPSMGTSTSNPTSGMPIEAPTPSSLPSTTMPGTPFEQPNVPTELPPMTATPGKTMPVMGVSAQTNITAVQKVAILSKMSAKGTTFEELSKDFYSKRPDSISVDSIDEMSYTDALDLVSFLNSK